MDLTNENTFIITLHNDNGGLRPYWATITQGIFYLGEPGSSVYRSRSKAACIRKAMRTISRIAARHVRSFNVIIEENK